jgi:hypothetical protein
LLRNTRYNKSGFMQRASAPRRGPLPKLPAPQCRRGTSHKTDFCLRAGTAWAGQTTHPLAPSPPSERRVAGVGWRSFLTATPTPRVDALRGFMTTPPLRLSPPAGAGALVCWARRPCARGRRRKLRKGDTPLPPRARKGHGRPASSRRTASIASACHRIRAFSAGRRLAAARRRQVSRPLTQLQAMITGMAFIPPTNLTPARPVLSPTEGPAPVACRHRTRYARPPGPLGALRRIHRGHRVPPDPLPSMRRRLAMSTAPGCKYLQPDVQKHQ